ncbi:uncharacterized protein LOC100463145 isoform X13 [Nasonia vitripennis]|uniref:Uncharacterized protein n=1 Tax=Nasonia vitripennis TaxID=7425 RepID=A0A7M7QVF5_NASVI|nr:uncharacterized protein LOC100463145 isoform X13 [Nasonia vitripennis]
MGKWRESKSEFYEDRLFVINKKFLQILGRWPYQAKRSRIFLLSLYFVGILTVVVAELIHFVRVIRIKDIPKIIDCLPALIFTYGAMVMIFNSMIKFAEVRRADRVFVHGLAVAAALSQHGRDKRDGRADHKPQGAARGDAQVLAEQPVGDDAALLHLVARPEDDRPQPPRARASVQRRLVRAAGGLEEASAADAAQELEGLPHHGRRHVPHEFRDLLQAHADFDVLLYHDSVDAVNFPSMYANKV